MTVCLLLAAGSSSRMSPGLTFGTDPARPGQQPETIPKMLLPFNGKTFLQHVIDEVKKVNDTQLLVVTGCFHSQLKEILSAQQIDLVENENWKEGMGSSIQKGIKHIAAEYNGAGNVIILVCDQPYISSFLINELIVTAQQTGKGIIASSYNGTAGTPVLFDKKYFDQLVLLDGQFGAKRIVQQFIQDTVTIAFPLGNIDIDTPEDYEKLN